MGHNISTCPTFLVAQHNVNVKRDELAQAERELASLEQLFSQHKAANSVRRAVEAKKKKKKSGEKGERLSKGSDIEQELFGDDPCVLGSEKDVPWDTIDVPGDK